METIISFWIRGNSKSFYTRNNQQIWKIKWDKFSNSWTARNRRQSHQQNIFWFFMFWILVFQFFFFFDSWVWTTPKLGSQSYRRKLLLICFFYCISLKFHSFSIIALIAVNMIRIYWTEREIFTEENHYTIKHNIIQDTASSMNFSWYIGS